MNPQDIAPGHNTASLTNAQVCAPEWRTVNEFEGKYEVSSSGGVRSLDRIVSGRCVRGVPRRPRFTNGGYLYVALIVSRDVRRNYSVARLVASAFIENPEGLEQVNHIDGVKTNNCVENLEWCSRSYNMQHAFRNGLAKGRIGAQNCKAKLSEEQAIKIKYLASTRTDRALAGMFGVSIDVIYNLRTGRTWKHLK